jgi:hypothetical protein
MDEEERVFFWESVEFCLWSVESSFLGVRVFMNCGVFLLVFLDEYFISLTSKLFFHSIKILFTYISPTTSVPTEKEDIQYVRVI